MLVAASVTWALVLQRFGRGDIYWVMGVQALAVCALVVWLRGHALRAVLWPRPRLIGVGLAAGVAMTAGTYAAFEAARWLVPDLVVHVSRLYRAAGTSAPLAALAWTLVILSAEELLWRDAWLTVWSPRWGTTRAAVISVLAYALTQLGSGSVIVALLAAVCGALWTLLRVRTGSLVPSLIAHAIWTPTVILLRPVV